MTRLYVNRMQPVRMEPNMSISSLCRATTHTIVFCAALVLLASCGSSPSSTDAPSLDLADLLNKPSTTVSNPILELLSEDTDMFEPLQADRENLDGRWAIVINTGPSENTLWGAKTAHPVDRKRLERDNTLLTVGQKNEGSAIRTYDYAGSGSIIPAAPYTYVLSAGSDYLLEVAGGDLLLEFPDRPEESDEPPPADGVARMFWNGKAVTNIDIEEDGVYWVELVLSGTLYQGAPRFTLSIDDSQVMTQDLPIHGDNELVAIRFYCLLKQGIHKLAVAFTNDLGSPDGTRNRDLFIHRVKLSREDTIVLAMPQGEGSPQGVWVSYAQRGSPLDTIQEEIVRWRPLRQDKAAHSTMWAGLLSYAVADVPDKDGFVLRIETPTRVLEHNRALDQLASLFRSKPVEKWNSKQDLNIFPYQYGFDLPKDNSGASLVIQPHEWIPSKPNASNEPGKTDTDVRRVWGNCVLYKDIRVSADGLYMIKTPMSAVPGSGWPVFDAMLDGKTVGRQKLKSRHKGDIKRFTFGPTFIGRGKHKISIRFNFDDVSADASKGPQGTVFLEEIELSRLDTVLLTLPDTPSETPSMPPIGIVATYRTAVSRHNRILREWLYKMHPDAGRMDERDLLRGYVTVGDSTREALLAPPSSEFRFRLEVPHKSRLVLGYGVPGEFWDECQWGLTFEVEIRNTKGLSRKLLESAWLNPQNVDEHKKWFDFVADLDEFAGSEATLVLRTLPFPNKKTGLEAALLPPDVICGAWANPRIETREPELEDKDPNVVLISLDTVRADHLSTYGYHRPTSPNLTRLAQEGVVFTNCSSQASWTLPSHASILTGQYPTLHGAKLSGQVAGLSGFPCPQSYLSEEITTVAEYLRSAGYVTKAIVAGGYVSYTFGMNQGFMDYEEHLPEADKRDAKTIFDAANSYLSKVNGQKFFLFLHTYEAHDYFRNRSYLADSVNEFDPLYRGRRALGNFENDIYRGFPGYIEQDMAHVEAVYDAAIRETDARLGEFLSALDSEGLSQNTLILVLSDHGEGFRENGMNRCGHQWRLHEDVLHVPLVIKFPEKLHSGKVNDSMVELVDVAPTILDVLNIDLPSTMQGRSLLPVTDGDGKAATRQYVLAEEAYYVTRDGKTRTDRSIRTAARKYIDLQNPELYAIRLDPGETTNLYEIAPRDSYELKATVDEHFSSLETERKDATHGVRSVDQRTMSQLKALGYAR